jgi:hypothetical protein
MYRYDHASDTRIAAVHCCVPSPGAAGRVVGEQLLLQ